MQLPGASVGPPSGAVRASKKDAASAASMACEHPEFKFLSGQVEGRYPEALSEPFDGVSESPVGSRCPARDYGLPIRKSRNRQVSRSTTRQGVVRRFGGIHSFFCQGLLSTITKELILLGLKSVQAAR